MGELSIRRALGADRSAIADLASTASHVVLQIPWDDLRAGHESLPEQGSYDFLLGCAGDTVVCACGVLIGPEDRAHLRVLAIQDDWPVEGVLNALFPRLHSALRIRDVRSLVFIGVEPWCVSGLLARGFRRVTSVITLQKTDFCVPDSGNQEVIVRPAREDDLVRVAEVDHLAFLPLWRKSGPMLQYALRGHPYFVVTEKHGQVVGYAYAYQQGRHGHLTRLAVHPAFQRQRIGARLLGEVIAFFARRGVFGITVNTQQDNLSSRRLYDWFGFVLLGKEADVLVYPLA